MSYNVGFILSCEAGGSKGCDSSEDEQESNDETESDDDDNDTTTQIQNPDGSYRKAEDIGDLIAMLLECETLRQVFGVIFANLYLILTSLI